MTGLNKAQRDILSHSLKHLCIEDVFAGSIMHPPHSGSFDIENLINSAAISSTTVFSDRMHVTTNNLTRYKSNISLELQSLVDVAKEVDLKLQGVEEVEKLWIRSEEAVIAYLCVYLYTVCMYVCMFMCVCVCLYTYCSFSRLQVYIYRKLS